MVVCHCTAVNDRTIRTLLQGGAGSVEHIAAHCGAGSRCGGCLDTIHALLAQHETSEQAVSIR